MATTDSSIQARNSPLSGTVDHEQLVIPCSTKFSDSTSNYLVENGSDAPASGETENGSAAKKPAWNKPSKSEVGAVMGAETWPALTESARASPKSSSTCSLKSLTHGSITISEKEAGTSISTPNSTSNHVTSMSQRSNGSLSQAPSTQGARINGARGNGSYHHHNHGVRRDPRRYFGTNQHRVPTPPPNAPFVSHVVPPPPTSSVAMRPFITPMVYSEVPPPMFYVPRPHPANYFRPMSMFPFSTVSFPMQDPHLPSKILNQIDYYFSNENLVKDTFLRRNMDDNGWVSIKLIANFKRVLQLTDNIQLILDAIRSSNVVEVQGDKVRRKVDWNKWIIPQSSHYMLAAG